MEGELSSLGRATEWLNSPSLTAAGLRGKVVLIDFCTYTCINWLRTLPYVRAWAAKYGFAAAVRLCNPKVQRFWTLFGSTAT